ncbi:hypothetical protein D3C73_137150 [compost metagenome]
MRVDFVRKGGHCQREHVFAVGLRQTANRRFVATGQRFADLFLIFTGEFEAQLIELNFAVPQRIQFSFIFRPRRFAAVKIEVVVAGEVHWTFQHFQRVLITFKTTLLGKIVEIVEQIEFTAAQLITDVGFTFCELFNVTGQQHIVTVIQQVQIPIKNFGRKGLIEIELTIM